VRGGGAQAKILHQGAARARRGLRAQAAGRRGWVATRSGCTICLCHVCAWKKIPSASATTLDCQCCVTQPLSRVDRVPFSVEARETEKRCQGHSFNHDNRRPGNR